MRVGSAIRTSQFMVASLLANLLALVDDFSSIAAKVGGKSVGKGPKPLLLQSGERIMQAVPWSLLGRESGHQYWQGSTTNAVQSYALGERITQRPLNRRHAMLGRGAQDKQPSKHRRARKRRCPDTKPT